MRANRANGGFTLIELMVVVIIIAALAAMILPKVLPAADSAKIKIAAGDIAGIKTAVQLYKLHEGKYPKAIMDLTKKSTSSGWNDRYLESSKVNDPWGRQYKYKFPGSHDTFDIWSLGIDENDASDDIKSWD